MNIKRTLLKAGFITVGAALGITGSVYALDKFEEVVRLKRELDEDAEDVNNEEVVEEKTAE